MPLTPAPIHLVNVLLSPVWGWLHRVASVLSVCSESARHDPDRPATESVLLPAAWLGGGPAKGPDSGTLLWHCARDESAPSKGEISWLTTTVSFQTWVVVFEDAETIGSDRLEESQVACRVGIGMRLMAAEDTREPLSCAEVLMCVPFEIKNSSELRSL